MPFIGNQPALSYTSFAKQDFTTSATTSYTLDNPVTNENELALFINFVRQEPTTAYTASGTTLTLTSATSATDDMYCVFLGKAIQTVNPPAGSVGASQISDGSITNAKLQNSSITLNGSAVSLGGSATVGEDNTPSFLAYLSSSQNIANVTATTLVFQTEVYDTASAYDTSNGIFTVPSGQGGKYFFTFGARASNWNTSEVAIYLEDQASQSRIVFEDGDAHGDNNTFAVSGIADLSAGNTVKVQYYQNGGGTTSPRTGVKNTWFGGFKIIGA